MNTNKKKMSKEEERIKIIKEEYGNKARLMSMDLMINTNNKSKNPNTHFSPSFNKDINDKIKKIGNQRRQTINTTHILRKNLDRNFFSTKDVNLNTENNIIINRQIKNNNYYKENKVKNSISFFPNIVSNTEKKKEKILLYQSNKNLFYNKKNLFLNDLTYQNQNTNFIDKNNKNLFYNSALNNNINEFSNEEKIEKEIPLNNTNINNTNFINIKNIKIDETNKKSNENSEKNKKSVVFKNLNIQNVGKFEIEKSQKKEKNIIQNMHFKSIIKKQNEIKIINNNDNSSSNSSMMEREFEKEKNKRNIIIIKEKIDKININNEALSSKINSLEDKFTPVFGKMNEICKIISLIYDTIKKEKNNPAFTIIHSTTNNINNKLDIVPPKFGNTIKNKILNDFRTKKGISLIYPNKKEYLNNKSTKKDSKDEKIYDIDTNEYSKVLKDDMNLLLRKIEPFLIKKFKKNQYEE